MIDFKIFDVIQSQQNRFFTSKSTVTNIFVIESFKKS
jgi:hypothetical protein